MKKIPWLAGGLMLAMAPLAAQTVTVTSPNGGESWALGTTHAITWNCTNPGSAVANIILRKGVPGTKVGDIKVGVALKAGSWTWDSAGTLADGTVVPAGTDYVVRIAIVGYGFHDDSNAAFALTGAAAPVMKKLAPLDRIRPIAFPPQPRITDFTMDKPTTFFRLNARNFGGALQQDAQVVVLLGSKQVLARPWPKGQETFAASGRLFANDGSPHLESCTQMGGGDYCLRAEIRSPEIQGFPYPGMFDLECAPCWQDLAVSGFQWRPTGELIFSVGNLGYCPSCAWSYRLYRMGELVETSARYGSMAPGAWSRVTAKTTMAGRGAGSCLFKVELVPESPGLEKNTANNACEVRAVRDALEYDVVISDIKLSGEVEYWEFLEDSSPTTDAYNRLVPMLKNTGNKEYPPFTVRVQVAFDDGPVEERSFTIAIAPHEEVPLSHSRWGVRMPVLPVGTHTVRVAVSVCPAAMKKAMTRPQG